MSRLDGDRLDLPYKKPLVVAGIGLVLLVVALAVVDRWRSERHLARLEASFCSLEAPTTLLTRLEEIVATATPEDKRPDDVASALTRWAGEGRIEAFLEIRGEPWSVPGWGGFQPVESRDLPRGYTSWAALKEAGCGGILHQGKYQLVRPLDSPTGQKVVLVWRVVRESDLFD